MKILIVTAIVLLGVLVYVYSQRKVEKYTFSMASDISMVRFFQSTATAYKAGIVGRVSLDGNPVQLLNYPAKFSLALMYETEANWGAYAGFKYQGGTPKGLPQVFYKGQPQNGNSIITLNDVNDIRDLTFVLPPSDGPLPSEGYGFLLKL